MPRDFRIAQNYTMKIIMVQFKNISTTHRKTMSCSMLPFLKFQRQQINFLYEYICLKLNFDKNRTMQYVVMVTLMWISMLSSMFKKQYVSVYTSIIFYDGIILLSTEVPNLSINVDTELWGIKWGACTDNFAMNSRMSFCVRLYVLSFLGFTYNSDK